MANEIMQTEGTNAIAINDPIDFAIPEGFICTLDLATDEGAIRATNAFGSADALSQYEDEEFVITDVITKPGQRAETGEDCVDVILVLDDDTCLFSQSVGILNSVQFMVASCGIDRLHRGARVKLVETKTRKGNTLKQLKLLGFVN